MRVPWTKAHPAKVKLAALILADHVIAASIFFNSYVAFRAFLQKEKEKRNYKYIVFKTSIKL